MAGLRSIIAALVTLEESLTLADPITVTSNDIKAYKVAPSRNAVPARIVTFMNWPDVAQEARMGDDREDAYTIQIDCILKLQNYEVAMDVALALWDKLWAALDDQRPAGARLSNTVDFFNMRSQRPMFETIEWADQGYPGFHMFIDLVVHNAAGS